MKTLLFTLLILPLLGLSQTYVSIAPQLTNTAGTLSDKSNVSLEVGRQWDVFSIGLDFGKTTLSRQVGMDTSMYLELRPNLNIFQQGKFTNTFTAGIGYVFNAENSLLTELTSGIEYAATPSVHVNVNFGQYYYSGRYSTESTSFFGTSVIYFFRRRKSFLADSK